MYHLTLLEALVITHFVADWFFRTKWETNNKEDHWLPLLVHCSVYTLGFIPVFYFYQLSYWWLSMLFVSHIILDERTLEEWLLIKNRGVQNLRGFTHHHIILLISDHILHLSVLALLVILV